MKRRIALIIAVLLLVLSGGIALGALASAHAGNAPASGTAVAGITWDAAMMPSGGHAEGPVGLRASVHGTGFPAGELVRMGVVAGDSNADPALCKHASTAVGDVTARSDGTFNAAFYWPAADGKVNGTYSICGYVASTGAVLSTHVSGTYTVLASSAPILILSTRSARAGQAVTVSGRGWVPPQPVTVTIRPNNSQTALATTHAISSGQTTGTFSVPMTIPVSVRTGSYTVAVSAMNGSLGAAAPGALSVTGTSAAAMPTPAGHSSPTPASHPAASPTSASKGGAPAGGAPGTTPGATAGTTPTTAATPGKTPVATATMTPSVTATASAGAGATPTATGHTGTSSSQSTATSGSTNWAVVGLSITVAALLGVIGALLALLYRRRRAEEAAVAAEHAAAGREQESAEAIPARAGPARAYPAPEEDWQQYAPAPYAPEREWQPSAPMPPAANEPWQGYAPFTAAPGEQGYAAQPGEHDYYAPPGGQAYGSPAQEYLPGAHEPGAYDYGPHEEEPEGRWASVPAGAGEPPPQEPGTHTWVWGQDLPDGPYAVASPGTPAPPPDVPAEQPAPAEDVLSLPGPWRLDPGAVPADLTLPALRGGPPREGAPPGSSAVDDWLR
jgi:hypothetical protein